MRSFHIYILSNKMNQILASAKKILTWMMFLAVSCVHSQPKNTSSTSTGVFVHSQMTEAARALCKNAESLIEDSLKTIAYENTSGMGDNSAPRETNRQLRIVAASNVIYTQQLHMQSLQCPSIQWSISYLPFTSFALTCSLAIARNEDYKEKCNRKSWSRENGKSE